MRKKKIIGIILAAALVAAGLGGFAYAQSIEHPMTGQKLVGYGFYGEQYIGELGGTLHSHTMFVFTNPDCVSEITIDRVFILDRDGTVLYDEALKGDDGIIEPHEVQAVELHDYLEPGDLNPVTVEIFWTCSHKNGLPLTGWTQTGYYTFDVDGKIVMGSVGENQMVNMEQVLEAPKKLYNIGVAQILTHPDLDATRQGFIDQMAEEGFIEGVNVKYDFRNPEGDLPEATLIAQEFVSENVDLILSITTPSSQACVEAAKDTGIPVVFAAVTDPVAAEIVESWDKPGGNVTGVSDWYRVGPQVKLIIDICPGVEKLGTIYNPAEGNSVMQIDELKKAAEAVGIEIVEATVAVAEPAAVTAAAQWLIGEGVDAIWIPVDNTVVSVFEAVVEVCEVNTIPLFGGSTDMVEMGAIGAHGFNYYNLGSESGKVAADVLRGKNPANIPVKKFEMTELFLNPSAAEMMGVTIPQSVLDKATKIVGE